MDLKIKRIARKANRTHGRMYVNGVYVCDTLELADRLYYGKKKIPGETAIPIGRYKVLLNVFSPRFGKKEPYKSLNNGCVPRLQRVKDFEGVLIHCGNTTADTQGCVLVGFNKVVGQVVNSRVAYRNLMTKYLIPARERKEDIYLTIV